jgi:hypothetical protein
LLLNDRPERDGDVVAEDVAGGVVALQRHGANDGRARGKESETHKEAHEDFLATRTVQLSDKGDGNKAQHDVKADLHTAESDNVAIDDASLETAHLTSAEDARVPVHAEGAALQELKGCLDDACGQGERDHEVEEDSPALSVLEAEKQQGNADLDERDGPVPEDLGDEEEAEGRDTMLERNEARVSAEAVEDGDGKDEVLSYSQELGYCCKYSFPL